MGPIFEIIKASHDALHWREIQLEQSQDCWRKHLCILFTNNLVHNHGFFHCTGIKTKLLMDMSGRYAGIVF